MYTYILQKAQVAYPYVFHLLFYILKIAGILICVNCQHLLSFLAHSQFSKIFNIFPLRVVINVIQYNFELKYLAFLFINYFARKNKI